MCNGNVPCRPRSDKYVPNECDIAIEVVGVPSLSQYLTRPTMHIPCFTCKSFQIRMVMKVLILGVKFSRLIIIIIRIVILKDHSNFGTYLLPPHSLAHIHSRRGSLRNASDYVHDRRVLRA